MKKDSIGTRMKENYENAYRIKLTRRMPVIIRLDGKAFHTLTRKCEKPFDEKFADAMHQTGFYLCENIQGAQCAYIQSDEISILLTDFDKLTTDAWFDNNLQKMVSISAGMASTVFSKEFGEMGIFDSRAFNIPKEEVCNYFVWRQQDWIKNSIQMFARAHFSHKQLQGKSIPEIHDMLHDIGKNWNDLLWMWKNGAFIHQLLFWMRGWSISFATTFSKDRNTIERYLSPTEE